jgi:hypothetical protein
MVELVIESSAKSSRLPTPRLGLFPNSREDRTIINILMGYMTYLFQAPVPPLVVPYSLSCGK